LIVARALPEIVDSITSGAVGAWKEYLYTKSNLAK
jgi:hypothetical protein